MKGTIYFAIIPEEDRKKKLGHMIAEELLRTGLKEEYGKDLRYEPRAKGEFGKPFFTLEPSIHYNVSHSGKDVLCILSDQEVGIDVQEHTRVNRERMLSRMVPPEMVREILDADDPEKAFFAQWTLREAYIKWTGQGLSRDMRTIPMDEGASMMLDLEDGYSAAVWSRHPMDIVMKRVEVKLPEPGIKPDHREEKTLA